jgi:hypothetical protein
VSRKPWMKFYPADWRADPRLRMCSLAARGLWIELCSLMHEAERYGHLVVAGVVPSPRQIASLVGVRDVRAELEELEAAGVFSKTEDGTIYSRRMVRDNAKALADEENGKGGGNPKLRGQDNGGVNPPTNPTEPEGIKPRGQKPDTRVLPPAPTEPPPRKRRVGSALEAGWSPSPEEWAYAEARGFETAAIGDMAENFRAYWTAGAGRNKTHADWTQAWQTWVRKEKPNVRPNGPGRVDARSVAKRIAEAEGMVGDADQAGGSVPAADGDGHGAGVPAANLPRRLGRSVEPGDRREGDEVGAPQVEILPVDRGAGSGMHPVGTAVATGSIEPVPPAERTERTEVSPAPERTGTASLRIIEGSLADRNGGPTPGPDQTTDDLDPPAWMLRAKA